MISHKTTPYNGTGFSLMRIQNIFISKTFWYYNNVYQPQYNNHLAETLSSHVLHILYKIKTASTYWVMAFQLRQGMEPPFASVPLERNTLDSTRTSFQPGHTWPTTHFAWVYRMYITNGWDQQLFPEWDSINNWFLEVNETLDQVIIHPTLERPT